MQELIVNALRTKLTDVPFADRAEGLAQVLRTTDGEASNAKRLPITHDNTPLVPDGTGKGLVYFEHLRLDVTETNGRDVSLNSLLRLVFWGDLSKWHASQYAETLAIAKLIKQVPATLYGAAPLFKMLHTVQRVLLLQDGLFDKYTYSEQQSQYLMSPYTAFGLDIKTTFSVPLNCIESAFLPAPTTQD